MIEWPQELNYYAEMGSYNLNPTEPPLRTEFDNGPARVRRRFTKTVPKVNFTVKMTNMEFEVLKSFYFLTLNNGVEWFLIPVFMGDVYVAQFARFVEPYKMSDDGFQKCSVTFSLECRAFTTWDEATAWLVGQFGYEVTDLFLCDKMQQIVNVDLPRITEDY